MTDISGVETIAWGKAAAADLKERLCTALGTPSKADGIWVGRKEGALKCLQHQFGCCSCSTKLGQW